MSTLKTWHQAVAEALAAEDGPREHSQRTSDCPSVPVIARAARHGWREADRNHARNCRFCQSALAGAWDAACPGWGTLSNYSAAPSAHESGLAIQKHAAGCRFCALRLRVLEGVAAAKSLAEGWHVAAPDLPLARGRVAEALPPAIHGFTYLGPHTTLDFDEEPDGLRLVLRSSVETPPLAISLVGETGTVPVELRAVEDNGSWSAEAMVAASDSRREDWRRKLEIYWVAADAG